MQSPPPPEPTVQQQTPLELLQQHLVQQSQTLGLTPEAPASTESSLLIQIQVLTEQLLASAAVASSVAQPLPAETTAETMSDEVLFILLSLSA